MTLPHGQENAAGRWPGARITAWAEPERAPRTGGVRLPAWALLVFGAVAGACADSTDSVPEARSAVDPCARSSSAAAESSDGMVVAGPVPCRLEFVPTGVRLRPAPDGSHPDPGRLVVRDSRGYYYSTNAVGFPATVAVWDSAGRFVRSIGGEGEGPGEFSPRGSLFIAVDDADRLYVRDSNLSWTVFSKDGELIRRSSAPRLPAIPDYVLVLEDGRAVSGRSRPPQPAHFFTVFSDRGKVLHSFGPIRQTAGEVDRPVAHAGGDRFWAAPNPGHPRGYVLELWSARGDRLRSLERRSPWFPRPESATDDGPTAPPPPTVGMIHFDRRTEFLMVLGGLANDRWEWIEDRRERERREGEFFDAVIEVIDTRSGTLLAAERMPLHRVRESIRRMIPGVREGYRVRALENGLPVVEIMTYALRPR